MQTPQGPPVGNPMQKFPSMTSVHSMLSQGLLPPGHGYVPKPIKPDKPYGPTFISIMNRTWRGPGWKYIRYAIITWCFAILFLLASGLYIGHRNVSRMIVLRTEWFGAIFTIIFILLFCLTVHFIYKARQASNHWRKFIRFRADGLYHVVPYNDEYSPEDSTPLQTGTYGRKALREIPKPGRKGRKKKKSQGQPQGHLYEKRGQQQRPPMEQVPEEPDVQHHPSAYKGAPPPGAGYSGPGGPGYEMSDLRHGAPQSRGFIPMDRNMDPGRYGYSGPQGGMYVQHSGKGESEL